MVCVCALVTGQYKNDGGCVVYSASLREDQNIDSRFQHGKSCFVSVCDEYTVFPGIAFRAVRCPDTCSAILSAWCLRCDV